MKKKTHSLVEALSLRAREHIALVGGGGKTTLMFSLAEELRRSGKRVVASTTTKVGHREALEYKNLFLAGGEAGWKGKAKKGLSRRETVFVGKSLLDSGKVEGIAPSLADDLFHDSDVDYLVVEADGSAGHPLKAPGEHEPVIPGSTTMVVAMMGLEAIGARLDETAAFRLEQVMRITGLNLGDVITPMALAKVFVHLAGLFKGSPEGARRVVFLNKGDLLKEEKKAEELAEILVNDPLKTIERVILGSLKQGVYQMRTEKERP